MRVASQELPPSAIPLCQLLPCHLWPPRPMLFITFRPKAVFCTIGAFHVYTSGARVRSRSSMPSCTSSSLDMVVTMSCRLTLQICLIIALLFRCRHWRFGFFNGSSLTGMEHCAPHTRAVQVATCLEREVARRELVAAPWTSSRQFSWYIQIKMHKVYNFFPMWSIYLFCLANANFALSPIILL